MGDFCTEKKTVVVTGFGPFGNHTINASAVAVEELSYMGISNDVELVAVQIPVEYDTVRAHIPELWKKYKPALMVHVGVSGIAKELTLEQQAHNDGYDKYDVKGLCPGDGCCIHGAACCIVSKLDMSKVKEAVLKSDCNVDCIVSLDPGRYLCDFIYFSSLHIDNSCSAFIHVPPLGKPYTGKQLAAAIRVSIKEFLAQLS